MKTIFHLLSAILVLQCHAIDRDRLQFDANQPKKELSNVIAPIRVERDRTPFELPVGDDCGACQETSPIINPAFTRTVTVHFDILEPINAFEIQGTVDFKTWYVVYSETPHLWIGLGHIKRSFTTSKAIEYYRLNLWNEYKMP